MTFVTCASSALAGTTLVQDVRVFEIAKTVHLSEGTVRNYLSDAISKLNAGNRIEAYRMARNAGWL